MILSAFRGETSQNLDSQPTSECSYKLIAPIGLQKQGEVLAKRVLAGFDANSIKNIRLRILPSPIVRYGDDRTFATFNPRSKAINASIHREFKFLVPKLLAQKDDVLAQIIPILKSLAANVEVQKLDFYGLKKLDEVLQELLEPKPEWVEATPEQYYLNKEYEIIQTALDLYTHYLSGTVKVSDNPLLIPETHVQYFFQLAASMDHFLAAMSLKEAYEQLKTTEILPYSFKIMNVFSSKEESITESDYEAQFLEHEIIHYLFDKNKDFIVREIASQLMLDEATLEKIGNVLTSELPKGEEDAIAYLLKENEKKLAQYRLIHEVGERKVGTNQAFDIFAELSLEFIKKIGHLLNPDQLYSLLFAHLSIGVEEMAIAVFYAPHVVALLNDIRPYVYDRSIIIPDHTMVQQLQSLKMMNSKPGDYVTAVIEQVLNRQKIDQLVVQLIPRVLKQTQ